MTSKNLHCQHERVCSLLIKEATAEIITKPNLPLLKLRDARESCLLLKAGGGGAEDSSARRDFLCI